MFNVRVITTFSAIIAVLFMLVGCGGGFESSFDPETAVSEMDDDDAEQFCEEQAEYVEDNLDMQAVGCMMAVAFFGMGDDEDAVAECQEFYDLCMSASGEDFEDEGDEEGEFLECEVADAELSECDATVGLLEACVEETVDTFNQIAGDFSCSDMIEGGEDAFGEFEDLAPACEELEEECPELFEDEFGSGEHDFDEQEES